MKRLWASLLAACLLLSLAACGGGEEDVETAWTPLQMARAILAAGGASAQEIAVLRLTEQADSDKAADALHA